MSVELQPKAGFCVKTTVIHSTSAVQHGLKVFVNIAWDKNVPPPPEASDDVVQLAMTGADTSADAWYVPVIVSAGREDTDKAGKLSLVFDCVFHTTVKTRTMLSPEFKDFLIEVSFQRIEAQSSIVLSRTIALPNIASKGKLQTRKVVLPAVKTPANKSLIQEVTPKQLAWTWHSTAGRIYITISVPHLTSALITQSSLDIESRRIILQVPDYPELDLNLDLTDAEITTAYPAYSDQILLLKRTPAFDIDRTSAEWNIVTDTLNIVI